MAYFRADLCLHSPESYTPDEKRDICNVASEATLHWARCNESSKATLHRRNQLA